MMAMSGQLHAPAALTPGKGRPPVPIGNQWVWDTTLGRVVHNL